MIPVVWLNLHPDECNHQQHWDVGLLHRLFAQKVWRPRNAYHFEYHDMLPPNCDGAVVMIAGRFHFEDVDTINGYLERLKWCLVMVTSDEESLFPVDRLEHPNMRVWVMTPKGPVAHADRYLGEGYPADTPSMLRSHHGDKPVDWAFMGQITHERRFEMQEAIGSVQVEGVYHSTESFAAGAPRAAYLSVMAETKVALCPSGPVTQDSFRFYEALEAGCVPVIEQFTPGYSNPDYWATLYEDTVPFPMVKDWHAIHTILPVLLTDWPYRAARCHAWWQQQKRQLAYDLRDTLTDVARPYVSRQTALSALPETITVIIPSSPSPIHPDTSMLEETVASVRERLPQCEIIIGMDGVRPEQEDRRAAYDEYRRRVCWLTNFEWHDMLPIVMPSWGHQANVTRRMLEFVQTPLVLFMEHDTPLQGDIDWHACADAIQYGPANVIRFHHESHVLQDHAHLMLDAEPRKVRGVPLLRTAQWSQRPHLASASFYRRIMAAYFGQQSRTMIEDVMHGVVMNLYKVYGVDGWEPFGVHLYAPEGDSIQRSNHLDGRGSDPKYPMEFEYDGPTPEGAPRAMSEREPEWDE